MERKPEKNKILTFDLAKNMNMKYDDNPRKIRRYLPLVQLLVGVRRTGFISDSAMSQSVSYTQRSENPGTCTPTDSLAATREHKIQSGPSQAIVLLDKRMETKSFGEYGSDVSRFSSGFGDPTVYSIKIRILSKSQYQSDLMSGRELTPRQRHRGAPMEQGPS